MKWLISGILVIWWLRQNVFGALPAGGNGENGGVTGGGQVPGTVKSAKIRWDPPVDGDGRALRSIGEPSGVHLEVVTEGAKTWGLRNVEVATGRVVTEASGLPVPAGGVIRLDDRTPVPGSFGLGRHRVDLILDGKIHPIGGQPEFQIRPTVAGPVEIRLPDVLTGEDMTGENPRIVIGQPQYPAAPSEKTVFSLTDPHAIALRSTR